MKRIHEFFFDEEVSVKDAALYYVMLAIGPICFIVLFFVVS